MSTARMISKHSCFPNQIRQLLLPIYDNHLSMSVRGAVGCCKLVNCAKGTGLFHFCEDQQQDMLHGRIHIPQMFIDVIRYDGMTDQTSRLVQPSNELAVVCNNNNNNITSMALKSSEARAQKRNKIKSVIIFKSRGHRGVIISFKGPPTI